MLLVAEDQVQPTRQMPPDRLVGVRRVPRLRACAIVAGAAPPPLARGSRRGGAPGGLRDGLESVLPVRASPDSRSVHQEARLTPLRLLCPVARACLRRA